MLSYLPILDVAASPADRAAPERFGGLPFGLTTTDWPRCAECGGSQSLLAQFAHHPERLDLGRAGRMLFVFQCAHDPGMCATWEAFSGANACLVVEPETSTEAETERPADAPPVEPHAVVRAWRVRDDGIAPEVAERFFRAESYFALDEEIVSAAGYASRLGGVPMWIQSPDEAPRPGWRFLGQLDSTYSFFDPPSVSADWVCVDAERLEGRSHYATGPNFGGGGIAYLFARESDGPPDVVMFWQCG